MTKTVLSIATSSFIFLSTSLNALTLEDSVKEVIKTNPIAIERLKNFKEVQQDLNIAKSEWLPSLDYRGSYGLNSAGDLKDDKIDEINYRNYTHSLKLTQNIFNGFSTTNKIDYQKQRILAAAYHYVENTNDVAFQMTGAYLDYIRSYKLLQNAKDNVAVNQKIFEDVQSLYESGLTTKSEVTKINSSLALAKSNLVVQQNNTIDKGFRFKRLLGRDVDISKLTLPKLDLAMPENLEKAKMYAIRNNPSIIVSNYNIKGAQSLYREKKNQYLPKIDFEIEQSYNDVNKENRYDSPDDRLRAYVVLTWNLYKGGSTKADIQKSKSTISKEVQIQRDLKRQAIESLELSWSAYEMITKQLVELYKYFEFSEETLDSYQSEYEMGRRTLLDLLSAQNDLINSKTQIINAQTDKLFAQYRILDAMGLLVSSILDEKEYKKIVYPTVKPFDIKEDSLPIKLDADEDKIVDALDICDNSIANDNISPTGCVQIQPDTDFDGVANTKDECPNTVLGAVVDEKGCAVQNQKNKFEVEQEDYLKEASKLKLNNNIFSPELDNHLIYDNFELIKRFEFINMNNFDTKNNDIKNIAKKINSHNKDNIIVTVVGHSKNLKDEKKTYDKALSYSKTIANLLIQNGVNEKAIVVKSRANQDNLFLQTNKHSLNDTVAISLYVSKTNKINLQVLFEKNSLKIKEYTKDKVYLFAKFLNENKQFNTVIIGHSSKTNENSSAIYNQKLSEQRANIVKKLLIQNKVEASRIKAVGKGFLQPLVKNNTEENKALNRRIEALLVPNN